jgi:hypothetical protein
MTPIAELALISRLAAALSRLPDAVIKSPSLRRAAYPSADIAALAPNDYARVDLAARDGEMLRRVVMQRPDRLARAA